MKKMQILLNTNFVIKVDINVIIGIPFKKSFFNMNNVLLTYI